ncbi:hypothetical protein H0H92_011223 [Tricholoma furcatifolium]|nr:hypothetical protein H0H92_011223 [Tricholoma furcatifolium]
MKTGHLPRIHLRPSLALVPRIRPRSNSASLHSNALLLAPPPPSARPPRDTKHLNQLALTSSAPDSPSVIFTVPSPARPLYDVYWPTLPLYPPTKPTPTHYTLDIAAYGIPKHPRRAFTAHTSDPTNLAVQVGEDAYFIHGNALGVADGVGGWAKRSSPSPSPAPDTSPSALFAKRLMHYTAAELDSDHDPRDQLEHHLAELQDGIDVLGILESAYANTVKAHVDHVGEPIREGSSTALVAVLQHGEPGPYVSVAQVGDCVGMVVREDQVVWRTEDMWWAWNTPVQLAPPPTPTPQYMPFHPPPPPTSIQDQVLVTPRTAAQVSTVPVRKDDILILASDGLSDNLWDEDVLDEVRRFRGTWAAGDAETPIRRAAMAGMLSEALCSRARRASERKGKPPEDPDDTPFARRAREAGKVFCGGKRDDISVLVAIVAQAEHSK